MVAQIFEQQKDYSQKGHAQGSSFLGIIPLSVFWENAKFGRTFPFTKNRVVLEQCSFIAEKMMDHVRGEVKTVQEEYIECEINDKRKKWNKLKLMNELTKLNHDMICLQTNRFHPFKNICRRDFSFLEQGRKYYTSREKLYAPMSPYIKTSSSNARGDGEHCMEKLIEHTKKKLQNNF
ncbi:conserved Plasmodium protein, unknown function [Plasmodium ovale curtisi]|uniref:Uncharacterized protein n=1 Tax=Plasmodium ovale curtisi TaxID=864141 RepID=A0A1A8WNA6_PLAOA|nr:conserved Plasmodium protein, unknown function [Plasmodium ovale curtisi]SBS95430.1 conserved Plasmodium protein, unknown function [Plasmodium ovale curtisi]